MGPQGTTNLIIEAAYADHAGALLRQLCARTRDPAAAEDLMHEAFLRLWLEVEAGRTPRVVRAWLFRVGANLATSRGRRLATAERHHVRSVVENPSPEALTVLAEQQRWVRDALQQVSATDRMVLILSATGHGGREIAQQIGRTEPAARVALHRARGRLRARVLIAAGQESFQGCV